MKILHTADWHLGKKLHKKDLSDDHRLFFDWLISVIKSQGIDVLLVSGDVFDSANPPNEARQLYYDFLKRMVELHCRLIITGGNHDAPAMLDAPRELLAMLNISVVGGKPENIDQLLFTVPNTKPELVIAAVPYLRDADLKQATEAETATDRIETLRFGIKNYYDQVAALSRTKFSGLPVLGMGHLYVQGAISSESEREIQIGNLAAFGANEFHQDFIYMALGHIHRPQRISESGRVRYSGSPIPLSFSEKNDAKIIIVLEFNEGKITNIEELNIPVFRQLKRLSGTFEEVKRQLLNFENRGNLKALLEVEVLEDNYNPLLIKELNEIIAVFESDEAEVLRQKISFKNTATGTDELFEAGQAIDEISEHDVLAKRLEFENGLSDEHRLLVLEAFGELLQSVKEEL